MSDIKRKLISFILDSDSEPEPGARPELGPQQIYVLDRGWVYVGQGEKTGDLWRIRNARNIRVWGTTKGLGELVDGPTDKTKLDAVGEILVPDRAVISIILCNRAW